MTVAGQRSVCKYPVPRLRQGAGAILQAFIVGAARPEPPHCLAVGRQGTCFAHTFWRTRPTTATDLTTPFVSRWIGLVSLAIPRSDGPMRPSALRSSVAKLISWCVQRSRQAEGRYLQGT